MCIRIVSPPLCKLLAYRSLRFCPQGCLPSSGCHMISVMRIRRAVCGVVYSHGRACATLSTMKSIGRSSKRGCLCTTWTSVTRVSSTEYLLLGSAHLSLLGRLLCVQVSVVLVRKGLGLHEEVSQVLLEGRVILQLEHALNTCLQPHPELRSVQILHIYIA